MNAGEVAELKLIATLCCNISKTINFASGQSLLINQIQLPIGNTLRTPNKFQPGINPALISGFSDSELSAFCSINGIVKAGSHSKADVYINGIGYSVKYSNASPPSLINHTPRHGWEFVAKKKGVSIANLDALIAQYWQKRIAGTISEDVPNTNPNSPFNSNIGILLPYLEYFIFEGTGSRLSKHPASEVIEYSDPCNFSSWKLLNKTQLVQNIWPRLIFSIREKGMPKNIKSLPQPKKNSVMLWARNYQGLLKGSLHVRIK